MTGLRGLIALVVAALVLAACGGSTSTPSQTRTTPAPSASKEQSTRQATLAPSPKPSLPPQATATVTRPATYTVQHGDTLSGIAQRYATTTYTLVAANHLVDTGTIYPGQTIAVPAEDIAQPTDIPTGGSAQVISRGPPGSNAVALTFDAGADTGYAAQILDTLSANGVRATFGMTGQWAERNPALLRRMVNEGHELINHTYDHGSFTGHLTHAPALTQAKRWDEVERTEAIVQEIAGVSTKPYFRPPY